MLEPMLKRLLPILLVLPPLALAGTYKWTDKDGNVHYSDKPVEGAQEVELPKPTTFSAPPVQKRTPPVQEEKAEKEKDPGPAYTELDFISPKQDQVFWATGGEIPVQLSLAPPLKTGHSLQLYADGELVPLAGLGTNLTEVWRGAHTVRAVVVDAQGKELFSVGPITYHVKQHSIANPQNPKPGKR